MDQIVGGDSEEGQSASRIVHIHCYSVGGGHVCSCVIVRDIVAIIRAAQVPVPIIPSKHTVETVSSPVDSSVTHWYINMSSPLCLQVTATSQTSCTQQLRQLFKSVWMIKIRLFLLHIDHLPVGVEFVSIVRSQKSEEDTAASIDLSSVNYWHQMFEWVILQFEADLFFLLIEIKNIYISPDLLSTIGLHQAPSWWEEGGNEKVIHYYFSVTTPTLIMDEVLSNGRFKVLIKMGGIRLSIPENVQFPVWILQSSRQQRHSWVSWVIVAQVQLFQTGWVGVQSWGQKSTAFLCDQRAWQPAKNIILHNTNAQKIKIKYRE